MSTSKRGAAHPRLNHSLKVIETPQNPAGISFEMICPEILAPVFSKDGTLSREAQEGQLSLDITIVESRRIIFDEGRAFWIFGDISRRYREGVGFYTGVKRIQPQWLYTPKELIDQGGVPLANFFFFLAMSQRGGLNSDDSIRLTHAVWTAHPEIFDPAVAAALSPREITRRIRSVAKRFYSKGVQGDRRRGGGSLSFKLEEFAKHWKQNATVLRDYWAGSVLSVFAGGGDFENLFSLIDRGSKWKAKNNLRGFYGMRRKIFALLCFWLIEFKLVPKFRIPLVVDFHVLRALFQLGIVKGAQWRRLGPGKPKIPERERPEGMWEYFAVRITEPFVNEVIAWSYEFLTRHNFSPFDVHNGLWNLSRVLCAAYRGNSAKAIRRTDAKGHVHALAAELVSPALLESGQGWPLRYRDRCRYCPYEEFCRIAVPAAPYYDWGMLVLAGRHVRFPGREETLNGVKWYNLPLEVTRRKRNVPAELKKAIGGGKETPPEAVQLDFLGDSKVK